MSVDPPHDKVSGNHSLMGARPQAGADLQNQHLNAMLCPTGLETCVVEMVRGWLQCADMWGHVTSMTIGSEPGPEGLHREWREAGRALRALIARYQQIVDVGEELGQPPCRLNFATIDRLLVAAMEWQAIDAEAKA